VSVVVVADIADALVPGNEVTIVGCGIEQHCTAASVDTAMMRWSQWAMAASEDVHTMHIQER
jgi:hypothetical protein